MTPRERLEELRKLEGSTQDNTPRGRLEELRAIEKDKSKSEPVEFSFWETVKNVPDSAYNFAKNLVQPIMHPVDTASSMYNLAMGGGEKLNKYLNNALPESLIQADIKGTNFLADLGLPIQRRPQNIKDIQYPHEQYADQFGQFMSDRYGSVDNIKKTIMGDPVGSLADASSIFTLGGSALSQIPKLNKVGNAVSKTGQMIEPINMAKGAGKYVASKATTSSLPVSMYESSAKFSTTIPKDKRLKLAETALKNDILPTSSGLDKLDKMINSYSNKIDDLILDAEKSGKMIPKEALFTNLKEVRKNIGGVKINAATELNQVNKVAAKLNNHLAGINKQLLTPSEVQAFKKDVYDLINFDAKNLKTNRGIDQARKAVARSAKEAIEKIADVKDLNKTLGDLLDLKEPLQRSANRIENRDLLGIGAPLKISAGGMVAGEGGAALGTSLALLENPKIKARLASKIYQIQKAGKLNLIDHKLIPTLIHLGLLQGGRLDEALPSGDVEGY